jgi:hypothetical protein
LLHRLFCMAAYRTVINTIPIFCKSRFTCFISIYWSSYYASALLPTFKNMLEMASFGSQMCSTPVEHTTPLGCGITSLQWWVLSCNLIFKGLNVKDETLLDPWNGTTRLSWNVGHQSPSDVAPYPKTIKTLTISLWKPKNSQPWCTLHNRGSAGETEDHVLSGHLHNIFSARIITVCYILYHLTSPIT